MSGPPPPCLSRRLKFVLTTLLLAPRPHHVRTGPPAHTPGTEVPQGRLDQGIPILHPSLLVTSVSFQTSRYHLSPSHHRLTHGVNIFPSGPRRLRGPGVKVVVPGTSSECETLVTSSVDEGEQNPHRRSTSSGWSYPRTWLTPSFHCFFVTAKWTFSSF